MASASHVLFAICFVGLIFLAGGADDVDVLALQTLVQQQAATITNVNAKPIALHNEVATLRNLSTDVMELKDRVATLSKAVVFTAMFSTDDSNNGIALSTRSTLQFDRAITNIGNGYNPHTGVFTAPLTGAYAFSLIVMVPRAHGPLRLSIMKQGATLDRVFAPDTNNPEDQGSTLVTTQLAAGEQVWVQQHRGNAVRGSYWTVFTGYLLKAE